MFDVTSFTYSRQTNHSTTTTLKHSTSYFKWYNDQAPVFISHISVPHFRSTPAGKGRTNAKHAKKSGWDEKSETFWFIWRGFFCSAAYVLTGLILSKRRWIFFLPDSVFPIDEMYVSAFLRWTWTLPQHTHGVAVIYNLFLYGSATAARFFLFAFSHWPSNIQTFPNWVKFRFRQRYHFVMDDEWEHSFIRPSIHCHSSSQRISGFASPTFWSIFFGQQWICLKSDKNSHRMPPYAALLWFNTSTWTEQEAKNDYMAKYIDRKVRRRYVL